MDLSNLDRYKESNRLEAKAAQGGLPRSIWETISAFANTNGGMIVLGAKERKEGTLEVSGLSNADKMLDDFWNAAHSSDKLYPCVLADRDVRIEGVEGAQLIVIDVLRADRHLRPVYVNGNPMTGTYRRDHKGDYRCAASEIHAMYRDASEESIDSQIRENLSVDDLSAESIASYRTSYGIHHDSHAWTELPTDEFLCRIGAAKIDAGGAIHPTSAGLLMFGEEWRIMAEFPHFFLDYRQELDPDERWQMRITSQDDSWSGNVFDFYRRVYNNMKQALQVPFRLDENSLRIDETDAHDALREALANCLTNADYHERRGVVILWKEDELRLSNPGGFRIDIEAAYIGGNSDPRNETMMKMFSLINVGERAGGGIPDMVRKWTKVGYERPILSEEVNPERSTIVLPLRKTKAAEDGRTEKAQLQGHRQVHLTKNQQMALDLAQSQGRVTTAILAQEAGISKQTASRTLKYLSDSELLSWHGTSKRDPSQYYDTPKLVWE